MMSLRDDVHASLPTHMSETNSDHVPEYGFFRLG